MGHYERLRDGIEGEAFTAPFSPRSSRNYLNRCEVEGCERRVYARGVCSKHYGQAMREARAAMSADHGVQAP